MEHKSIYIDSRGKAWANSQGFISKYLSSRIGRMKLAQSMVAPLRRTINYSNIAKNCFTTTPLPQGALPTYNKVIDNSKVFISRGYAHRAVTVSNRGKGERSTRLYYGQRVTIPKFEIFKNPTIHITDVKSRRFNLIDRSSGFMRKIPIIVNSREKASKGGFSILNRAVQKARQQIMAQEDAAIFQALDAIGKSNDS